MNKNLGMTAPAVLFICGLFGCKVVPPKQPLVETVAVLPFDNETNDLNAPDLLQKLVYEALSCSVYKPLNIEEINKKLESVGLVDGGQLAIVDPNKLGKDLGVQALIFGYVENFDYTNVGFYAQRKVKLSLKMVDVATSAILWEAGGTGLQPRIATNKEEAKQVFIEGLAQQVVDKVVRSPLHEEAERAVQNALKSLPGFQFHGFKSKK